METLERREEASSFCSCNIWEHTEHFDSGFKCTEDSYKHSFLRRIYSETLFRLHNVKLCLKRRCLFTYLVTSLVLPSTSVSAVWDAPVTQLQRLKKSHLCREDSNFTDDNAYILILKNYFISKLAEFKWKIFVHEAFMKGERNKPPTYQSYLWFDLLKKRNILISKLLS